MGGERGAETDQQSEAAHTLLIDSPRRGPRPFDGLWLAIGWRGKLSFKDEVRNGIVDGRYVSVISPHCSIIIPSTPETRRRGHDPNPCHAIRERTWFGLPTNKNGTFLLCKSQQVGIDGGADPSSDVTTSTTSSMPSSSCSRSYLSTLDHTPNSSSPLCAILNFPELQTRLLQ